MVHAISLVVHICIMSDLKIHIKSGSGGKVKVDSVSLSKDATIKQLKNEYSRICKKSVHRLSFKKESNSDKIVRLDDDNKTLHSYGVESGETIVFKDLGPQIGYRTVFVVEYLGPLLIVLFYSMRPAFIFGANAAISPWNWVAKLGLACWVLHFVKRELETFFVHKFSRYVGCHRYKSLIQHQ